MSHYSNAILHVLLSTCTHTTLCVDSGMSAFGSEIIAVITVPISGRIVPVCEPSVMIAVSSAHRKEAIESTSYAIDAIKSSVAIWKKVRSLCTLFFALIIIIHRRCMQKAVEAVESGKRIKSAHGHKT